MLQNPLTRPIGFVLRRNGRTRRRGRVTSMAGEPGEAGRAVPALLRMLGVDDASDGLSRTMISERAAWRAAVNRSTLPASVKLVLLAHSESGPDHHLHDIERNLHGYTRERLAAETGMDQRTVTRHLARAESEGWLARHERAHRGHQATFHYLTPDVPNPCPECGNGRQVEPGKGDTDPARLGDSEPIGLGDTGRRIGRQKGGQKGDNAYTHFSRQSVSPSSYLQEDGSTGGAVTASPGRSPVDQDDQERKISVVGASFQPPAPRDSRDQFRACNRVGSKLNHRRGDNQLPTLQRQPAPQSEVARDLRPLLSVFPVEVSMTATSEPFGRGLLTLATGKGVTADGRI